MLGDQVAMTHSHYGDRSDYKDGSGLLTLHLIALGNTHKGKKTKQNRWKALNWTKWDRILIMVLEAMRGDGVHPEENQHPL